MSFIQRVRGAYNVLTSKQLSSSIGQVNRNYVKGSVFQPTNQLRGITYKAIDKIGMAVSVYEPLAVKANGDPYENHPIYNLVEQPNPITNNSSDFHHLYAMLYEIYGETFWYIGAVGEFTSKIKEVHLLDPSRMELKFYNGELVGYVLHKENGVQVPLELEEIIHDKRPNPFNPHRGLSVMERAATYIDTEIVTSTFTLNYIKNNASPSGIVSLPDMDREAFKQFAQQWREGYEGPENAGKTAFIRGGEASFKAVGATLQDIDQKVTREMAKDDVLAMFDVPKGLLGITSQGGLGRNEIEPLEYVFAKWKIDPMMNRLDRIWTEIMKRNSGRDGAVKIDHQSIVPKDKEYRLKLWQAGVNRWITPNEIREEQGLEPIDGGDDLKPEAVIQPVEDSVKRISLKKAPTASEIEKEQHDKNEAFREAVVKKNEIYEIKVKRAISKFASDQEKYVIGRIDATSKTFEEWLFSVKEYSEELASILIPILEDLVKEQGAETVNFITGQKFEITPELRATVANNITQISGVYNLDTLRALEKTLAEGQAKGESLSKLKKRVEATFSDAKGYRAERIARTESLNISNLTAEDVYKQNGFEEVEWFINPGACEFCRTYAGRTKKIGQKFNNIGDVIEGDQGGQLQVSYKDIEVPPLHPNCTCSLVPA